MVHEALNMAALWKTNNVVFVEHNMYGLTVRADRHLSVENISDRAAAYGIPGVTIDGNDIIAVIEATQEAVDRARRGEGPTLIEAKTYRVLGFSTGDKGGYQPQEEIDSWTTPEKDPITRYGKYLVDKGICTAEEVEALHAEAQADVDAAIQFGLDSPYPDPSVLMEGIYV
jgi:pyruvate dehydrogenase E1 component alpha subunit